MNLTKTVFALLFTLIVSASIPSPVFAAVQPRSKPKPVTLGGFSLSPTVGGYFFAGSEQLQSTPLYGLKFGYDRIGKSITESLGVEGTLNYFETKPKSNDGSATGYLLRIDALYPFLLQGKTIPYLALGAGAIITNGDSFTDKNPFLNYGASLKYFFEDYLALRADARHLLVYNNVNTRNNFEFSIGLSYYFGKERKKKPEPPPDSDKDGVPDRLDKCPNTPKGVTVDKNGCPTDSDKDSVADYNDKCPDTPMGIVVNTDGCPQDGGKVAEESATPAAAKMPQVTVEAPGALPAQPEKVPPPAEKLVIPPSAVVPMPPPAAPETAAKAAAPAVELPVASAPLTAPILAIPAPAGPVSLAVKPEQEKPATLPQQPASAEQPQPLPVKVAESVRQAVGRKVVRKLTVEFASNSSYIQPKYYKKLREIAGIMKSAADATAKIEGHSDSTGKLKYNMKLSKERARSVRSSLIKLGVESWRISTVGHGPAKPMADNATIKGKQRNRRAVTLVTVIVYE